MGGDCVLYDKMGTNTPHPTNLAHLAFSNLELRRKEIEVKMYSLREEIGEPQDDDYLCKWLTKKHVMI